MLYPDLHGVARGKDVPIAEFDYVLDHGLRFCAAVMGTDLRHTPVVGGDEGYPDPIARPDMTTMATSWEPGVASCLADLEPAEGGAPIADPRGAVRRAAGHCGQPPGADGRSRARVFPARPDLAAEHRIRRHVDQPSMFYTVGPQADPGGIVRVMTEGLAALDCGCSPSTTSS